MGKRKRAKPPPKKAKPKVSQVFDCPFCGGKDLCGVTMDYEHSTGFIKCDACGAKYEMQVNRLTEAIDVYSEWIDMSEQVNREAREGAGGGGGGGGGGNRGIIDDGDADDPDAEDDL